MSLRVKQISYRCSDDCNPAGCPWHVASGQYNTVTGWSSFCIGGKTIDLEQGELQALKELISLLQNDKTN